VATLQTSAVNSSPTFDRVYPRIRTRILKGWWRPGERIDVAALADELGASITPVRDALYRLVGERLIVLGVSEGFAAPGLTEPGLRDRYHWSQMLVLLALGSRPTSAFELVKPPQDSVDLETWPARLFRDLAAATAQSALVVAMDSVGDQLAHARVIEVQLGIATLDELSALFSEVRNGTAAARRRAISRYHRRRMQQCGRIVEAMHLSTRYDRR
jgi:DNA-binding FadR family transcriptional regulator